jgi:hypothetical protein
VLRQQHLNKYIAMCTKTTFNLEIKEKKLLYNSYIPFLCMKDNINKTLYEQMHNLM